MGSTFFVVARSAPTSVRYIPLFTPDQLSVIHAAAYIYSICFCRRRSGHLRGGNTYEAVPRLRRGVQVTRLRHPILSFPTCPAAAAAIPSAPTARAQAVLREQAQTRGSDLHPAAHEVIPREAQARGEALCVASTSSSNASATVATLKGEARAV